MCADSHVGCDQDSPKDEYNDFRRTAGARQDGCGASIKGARSLISLAFGRCVPWNGGISLGLRIQVSAASGETENPPRRIQASLAFEQSMDVPLVTSETAVDEKAPSSWRTL